MARLVLDLSSEEDTELGKAALLEKQTPQQLVKTVLADYLQNRQPRLTTNAVSDVAISQALATGRPNLSGGIQRDLTPEEARQRRAEAKGRMPGFGLLKGKLQVDGIDVADGVEYQNRLRDTW